MNLLLQLVLLQYIIVLANHAVVLSVSAKYSQTHSQILSHENSTMCSSVWFEYNQATQDCQCIGPMLLICEGETIYADTHYIYTYDSNTEVISAFKMRHKYLNAYNLTLTSNGSYGILLPNNISELNQYMCDPLNRKHYLCSDCKSGYGPAIISESASCANECFFCEDTWYKILLYLSLNFIPLTAFYLLILIFQIRLTSAQMTCFIMYSQLVVLAFYEECGLTHEQQTPLFSRIKFTDSGTNLRTETKSFLPYIVCPILTSFTIFCLRFVSVVR